MKVRVERERITAPSPFLVKNGYTKQTQYDVSPGEIYEVVAISVFKGVTFFQVRGESEFPAWIPALFFSIVDSAIPLDWICNSFDESLQLVMGPRFVAESEQAYRDMVELVPQSVEEFERRVAANRS